MGLPLTSAQFILTQSGAALYGPSPITARVELDAYAGDGNVSANDLHPYFSPVGAVTPPLTILGSFSPGSLGAFGTEVVFDLDPAQLVTLATGNLLTLRFINIDTDGFTGVPIFMNESVNVDYNAILPGVQGGVAPRLSFEVATTVIPLPASLPLFAAGLGRLLAFRRRSVARRHSA